MAQQGTAAAIAEVKAADAAYWKAYNSCDYAQLDALTADDVEFYHDKGGITNGRAALTDSIRKNICGNPAESVLRSADDKDVRAFPLNAGPQLYGVLLTGTHKFSAVIKAGKPIPTGEARFTMLWTRKDGAWKLSRVFSYDHQPPRYQNQREAITLAPEELDQFTGSYSAKMQPVFIFRREGSKLVVDVGGRPMAFYPLDKTSFFTKDMDVVVEFRPAVDGRSPGFAVKQNGQPVDEGKRL